MRFLYRLSRVCSTSKSASSASSPISVIFRNPGFIDLKGNPWSRSGSASESTLTQQEAKISPTERVSAIVDEIASLTLLEVSDLTELLRQKLGIEEMPSMGVVIPGMGFKGPGQKGPVGTKVEEKAEKTAFDLKLESFEAASKIKIIKEVRTFTDLGLKEAKDLVEKAPTVLKKGVLKEEAEKIIEKMKEAGAKVVME